MRRFLGLLLLAGCADAPGGSHGIAVSSDLGVADAAIAEDLAGALDDLEAPLDLTSPPDLLPMLFHMTDSLKGSTQGHLVGGTIGANGWTVNTTTDRVWYAIPRLTKGSIEFTITNLDNTAFTYCADTELFSMYEAGFGMTEPVPYSPQYRNNHYKCFLRARGERTSCGDPQQWAGQIKLQWGMCASGAPGYDACTAGAANEAEPFGGDPNWDGSAQRIRVAWGDGKTTYSRNGVVVVTVDWSGWNIDYGPSELHFMLGSPRPTAVGYSRVPVGAVYSDLVVDGTIGPLALPK